MNHINLQLFADGQAGSGDGGQQGQAPAGGQGGGSNEPKTFDEAYVKQLRDEAASHRVKAKEFEDKLKALEAQSKEFPAKLLKALGLEPDPNKAWEKQVEEAKTAAQAATEKANQRLIRAEVKVLAKDLGIVDPDAAFALADLSKVQVAEDGTVSGVMDALEALVKAKPYLVGKAGQGGVGSGSNPGAGAGGAQTFTREQIKRMTPDEINANWATIQKQMEAGTLK